MAWVEANAFPEAGKARKPAADDFNAVECSDTSFQYRLSKRGSTRLTKPTIDLPIREFYKSIAALPVLRNTCPDSCVDTNGRSQCHPADA